MLHLRSIYDFPIMNKRLKLATSLLVAAGTFAIVGAAPANAAACADGTLTALLNVSCTSAEGFTFKITSFSGFAGADTFSFTNGGTNNFQYSLQGSSAYVAAGSPYAVSYELTAPSGRLLDMFTTGGSTSIPGANSTWVISENSAQNKTASGTVAFSGQTNAVADFIPNILSTTFTGTLNVSAQNISSVTSLVTSDTLPVTTVPGPLPILGAAAAFGFSRKVRNRIKAAS